MKKKLKSILTIACSVLLIFVLGGTFYLSDNFRGKTSKECMQLTRTVETTKTLVDYQNDLKLFEKSTLNHDGTVTTFEGYQTINLADLTELDEVSDLELDENANISVKYNFGYDYETNLVTLTVLMITDEQETIIDTVYGAAFVNENGDIDALLEIDDETILLSELQESGAVQECGWFKKALKKVKNAVKTVCKTAVGVVGAVATVVVPAAIGVAMAATGVGLVATIAVGAVAGATIAGATAAASTAQQNNGKVDWETVGICAGVGGAVGALASAVGYGITKAVQALSKSSKIYQVAYVVGNKMVINPTKLNYITALSILVAAKSVTLSNITNLLLPTNQLVEYKDIIKEMSNSSISKNKIGIYTYNNADALKLAVALGCSKNSSYDLHGSIADGYKKHYHDKDHFIHIWYDV